MMCDQSAAVAWEHATSRAIAAEVRMFGFGLMGWRENGRVEEDEGAC